MTNYVFKDGKVYVDELKAASSLFNKKRQHTSGSVVLVLMSNIQNQVTSSTDDKTHKSSGVDVSPDKIVEEAG